MTGLAPIDAAAAGIRGLDPTAEQVRVHARSPYGRVDTLRSSRLVEIRVGGETVARSIRPLLLFETHLPTRYYLPYADVRAEFLEASDTVTECPYKGVARCWSVRPWCRRGPGDADLSDATGRLDRRHQ